MPGGTGLVHSSHSSAGRPLAGVPMRSIAGAPCRRGSDRRVRSARAAWAEVDLPRRTALDQRPDRDADKPLPGLHVQRHFACARAGALRQRRRRPARCTAHPSAAGTSASRLRPRTSIGARRGPSAHARRPRVRRRVARHRDAGAQSLCAGARAGALAAAAPPARPAAPVSSMPAIGSQRLHEPHQRLPLGARSSSARAAGSPRPRRRATARPRARRGAAVVQQALWPFTSRIRPMPHSGGVATGGRWPRSRAGRRPAPRPCRAAAGRCRAGSSGRCSALAAAGAGSGARPVT